MSTTRVNKAARQDADRVLIAGITKNLSGVTQVMVDGTAYTPAQIVALLQAEIAATDAVGPAHALWLAAVEAQRAATNVLTAIKSALRSFVVAKFGKSSTVLADFGYTKQARTPSPAVQVVAVAKRAKTRVLRGTKGKLQKAKLTAEASPAAPTAASKPVT